MSIYRPYETLADTYDCLHLKEPETRERVHFILYRILPIFILFFVWFIIQQNVETVPMGWNYLLVTVAVLSSALLFFKSYIIEIKITANEIYILQKNISGPKEITLAISDVEKIILKRKRGRSVSVFFFLHTKQNKTYSILSIPGFYIDEHHISLIRERLKQMLRTEVIEE